MDITSLRSTCLTPGCLEDFYTIGEHLGSGACAAVKRGESKSGEPVAIKIFKDTVLSDEKTERRLLFEILVLKRAGELKHPNIGGCIAAFRDKDAQNKPRMSIITPLCMGGELFDHIIAIGHYSENDAASLFRKICGGVQTLHEHGILHRDLKPENILMSTKAADAEPVICDFGFASLAGYPDVYATNCVGTFAYMAPEVYISKTYGPHVDVFSLGVVLYILLCGYPPFYADDCWDKLTYSRQIVNGRVAFQPAGWATISPSAIDLVKSMLKVDHHTRITLPEVLSHPWMTEHAALQTTHLAAASSGIKSLRAIQKLRAVARAIVWSLNESTHHHLHTLSKEFRTLSPEEIMCLRDAFQRHVESSSTTIGREEFKAIMLEVGYEDLPLDSLFDIFHKDATSTCDFRDILTGLSLLRGAEGEDKAIRLIFDIYDTDHSGSLSFDEISRLLVTAGFAEHTFVDPDAPVTGSKLTEAGEALTSTLTEVFKAMDTNADGTVSFDEFKKSVCDNAKLKDGILRRVGRGLRTTLSSCSSS